MTRVFLVGGSRRHGAPADMISTVETDGEGIKGGLSFAGISLSGRSVVTDVLRG